MTSDDLDAFIITVPGNTKPRGQGEATTTTLWWDRERQVIALTIAVDSDGSLVTGTVYSVEAVDRLTTGLAQLANLARAHGY